MSTERLKFGIEGSEYQAMLAAEHVSRYFFVRSLCAGKRVLDIACGEGYGSRLLAQWGAKEVVGVDIAAEAIRKAEEHFSAPNVRFIRADACNLDQKFLLSEKFDVICSFETIEHVDNVQTFLANIHQLRTNNTAVIISCPNDSILPDGISNPFHRCVFKLDEFKSETEKILGKAAGWFFGTPLQGYTISPDVRVAESGSQSMDLAMTGHDGDDLWVLPSQQNIATRPDNVDFFIGLWGYDAPTRASVASSLSQTAFVEPWQSLETMRSALDAVNSELRSAKAALESMDLELERRISDLRRTEIVLAEERRAALNYRARMDLLQEIKIWRREEIREIAREVWWERNRRGLPYRIGKLIKRVARRT